MSGPTSVIDGMPDPEYRAIRALSYSGAKLLTPPSCPALFRHNELHGRESTDAFDFGHAAHKRVLGVGAEIRYITGHDVKGNPSEGWGTKDAKEQKAKAYADGAIPLLEDDRGVIEGMAAAIQAHPIASKLFDPARGKAEQSIMWTDDATGVPLKARIDFLPTPQPGRRLVVGDYKTSTSASPHEFDRTAASYDYHRQAAWYADGCRALGLASTVGFVFVVQEKRAPYLVSVIELDGTDIRIGRALNRQAINIYAECIRTDTWPGYGDEIHLVSLPAWYRAQHEGL